MFQSSFMLCCRWLTTTILCLKYAKWKYLFWNQSVNYRYSPVLFEFQNCVWIKFLALLGALGEVCSENHQQWETDTLMLWLPGSNPSVPLPISLIISCLLGFIFYTNPSCVNVFGHAFFVGTLNKIALWVLGRQQDRGEGMLWTDIHNYR